MPGVTPLPFCHTCYACVWMQCASGRAPLPLWLWCRFGLVGVGVGLRVGVGLGFRCIGRLEVDGANADPRRSALLMTGDRR